MTPIASCAGSGAGDDHMSRRPRLLRPLLWLAPVAVAALSLAVTTAPAAASDAPTSATCAARVNDTPEKLLPCIKTADLWQRMRAFQAIANANPGPDGHPSRNSGEPGYKASADYVARVMKQAG